MTSVRILARGATGDAYVALTAEGNKRMAQAVKTDFHHGPLAIHPGAGLVRLDLIAEANRAW